jgi:hypothetical protein
MRKFIGGASIFLALAGPAHAWDDPPKPAPAPAATAIAGASATAINQNNISSYNINQNKQLQFQGQFQKQTATGGVGNGGAGGNVTNNITTGGGGGATPATAVNPNATVNNNAAASQPGSTYSTVYTQNGNSPWNNPAASAVAPSVYAASICQSAISGAAQTPLFGLSFGSVQGLDVCIKMMMAEQAKTNGRQDMATYFYCQAKEWRDAFKATGTPCPQDAPKQTAQAVAPMQTASTLPPNCSIVQPGNYVTCR